MRLLVAEGAAGLPAGEIATRLPVRSSTLSFHLAALEGARLTRSSRQGRQIAYALRIVGVQRLINCLTETCCGWHIAVYGENIGFWCHRCR